MDKRVIKVGTFILDKALPKAMTFIIAFTQLFFTAVIFGSVVARVAFGRDLYGNEDFVLIAAFWLYMIGGAYGSYNNSHIKADIVAELMKDGLFKRLVTLGSALAEVAVTLVITFWGWQLVLWGLARGAKSISWKIPMFIPQGAIFIGFAVMFIYSLRRAWSLWQQGLSPVISVRKRDRAGAGPNISGD